ncbi:hypothetical protein [Calderihabitans maritimus]|uniref:Uncharacterized protein n=1 Tax=Calderihabitans maritimus TaxID=1246530 RepID=A0A1Z5HVK7_9FIRM|nr:hypothetical protein [Calderihabitans maritimus]GAW93377.1 hypothetical protein KKC1_25120 [Calderihabitans maritimus]
MVSYIQGKLKFRNAKLETKLKEELVPIGYEITRDDNDILLKKVGKVEAVLSELVPICERLGWNVEEDLILMEKPEDPAGRPIRYVRGKIHR